MSDIELTLVEGGSFELTIEGPVTTISGGAAVYRYEQNAPSLSWVVNHNLNRACNEAVYNLAGERVNCDVTKPSLNTIIFSFLAPQTGFAEIS
jgi:hypothetical protein